MLVHKEMVDEVLIHVLFQNQLWLQQKCETDSVFKDRYGEFVLTLNTILKNTNLSRGLTAGAAKNLKRKLREALVDNLYSERNIKQISEKVMDSFTTKSWRPPGVETKLLPPKRYIGIGYRDKGSARDPARDGSPSWQVIASYISNLERQIQEKLDELERISDQEPPGEHIRIAIEIRKEVTGLVGKLQMARANPESSPRDAEKTANIEPDFDQREP
jgi:hypothetical protein